MYNHIAREILTAGPRSAGRVSEIVSIGTHCITANLIKKFGLKRASYPFDWIFCNPEMFIHCLSDDFKDFLDRGYHKTIEYEREGRLQPGADHTLFRDRYDVGQAFTHRDVTKDEEYEYFQRGVERFRNLRDRDDVLLVMMSGHPFGKKFSEISRAVSSYFSYAKLLCVDFETTCDPKNARLMGNVVCDGDHYYYNFVPFAKPDGAFFHSLADEVDILKLFSMFEVSERAMPV